MVGNRRQGWALYAAMVDASSSAIGGRLRRRAARLARAARAGVQPPSPTAPPAATWRARSSATASPTARCGPTVTTDASNGSVNSAHESYTGIGGAVPLANMMTGEVIFGGVGSGLYGMLLFVLLAVFIAGLMVGRTPEYLGKKIEAREIKLVADRVAVHADGGAGRHRARDRRPSTGRRRSSTPGPQGFSETLYAYTSQANNNGSAFAGYTGFVQPNAPGNAGAYGITLRRHARRPRDAARRASCRCSPRSRSPARWPKKRVAPAGPGTFRTDTPTFVVLLIGVIVIVAALTFFPALLLGPVVQGLTNQLF